MGRPNVTTNEINKCFCILKTAIKPLTAAEIGWRLHLGGKRETQRRHVRLIIEELRKRDNWIAAVNPIGYFLTHDFSTWKDYLAGRKIETKRVFGELYRREKRMLADSEGQRVLFDEKMDRQAPVPAGSA